MSIEFENRHKKLMAWIKLAQVYPTLEKAKANPHYWIEAQDRNIVSFVNYLYTIPFYKKRFDDAGITPNDIRHREDFKKLPPLTKQEYREWLLTETQDKSDASSDNGFFWHTT